MVLHFLSAVHSTWVGLQFVISSSFVPTESEVPSVDISHVLWKLICTSLHKAQRRVLKLQQTLNAQTDQLASAETMQLAVREQNDAFNLTKQHGVALLQSLQGKHERRAEVVQGQLYALAVQFSDLQSLLSDCE
jgi:hypothetical protein